MTDETAKATEAEVTKTEAFAMPHPVSELDIQYANDNALRIVLTRAVRSIGDDGLAIRPRAIHDCPHLGNKVCAYAPDDESLAAMHCENLAAGSGNIVFCKHTFHPVVRGEEKPHAQGVREPQGSVSGDAVHEGPVGDS